MGASPQDADGSLTTAGDTWARGLAGMDDAQLARGLKVAIIGCDDGWPLNLPMFRAAALGIPDLSAIRRELANSEGERSGFAVLVWRNLDSFAYRCAEGKAAEWMLKEAYNQAREFVMGGGKIPEPALAIAPPNPDPIKPASPESVAAAVAEMRKLFSKGDAE